MGSRSDVLRLLIRLTGPVLLVAVIWNLDDKAALWAAVSKASWPLLGTAVVLILPVIHLKVVRWRGFLDARGFSYPLDRTYAAVLPSLYLGMLTPGRVGDALRIQYAHREIDVPYSEGLATTLIDRFCDLYVLAGVAALGTAHFGSVLRNDLAYATWLAVAIALLAPMLLLTKGPAEFLGRFLRRFTERWHTSLDGLLTALRALVKKRLIVAILLTVAAFAINYFQGWLVARAIGIELSYVDVASLLSATTLLGLMP
ncbi:MAG: flippase-like domain-containing protein, partial [Myxococcales bacterium]|nr:flippase-like domain-containing protein [Myxococcales bacterium]